MIIKINGTVTYDSTVAATLEEPLRIEMEPIDEMGSRPNLLRALMEKAPQVLKAVRSVKADQLLQRHTDDYLVYELQPTTSVRNNQAAVLAKVIAGLYRSPGELRSWFKDGAALTMAEPYRVNFRVVMTSKTINFYLLLPKEKGNEIIRKAEAVYDNHVVITQAQALPTLDPALTYCTEVAYRKHDIFSLDSNAGHNYPLPSLLTAVRSLEEGDVAIFDAMLEPYNRLDWYRNARDAHNLLDKGYIPNAGLSHKILQDIHSSFNSARTSILQATRFTRQQRLELQKYLKEESTYQEAARIKAEMTNPTKRKAGDDVLQTWLRIAVQSADPIRARDVAYTLGNAWKDLTSDNELDRTDVPASWVPKYVEAIENRKPLSIKKPSLFSVEEAGKLLQLPGRELMLDFPQIQGRKFKDSALPEEITQENIKGVTMGWVTERGIRKTIKVPLEPYKLADGTSIKQSAVYDAFCTATFKQGKQGTGKTAEEAGESMETVKAGHSAIIIDTADGQILRDFVNALPDDYPEEKIHAINLDDQANPVPLGWEDIYGRDFNAQGDEELAALQIQERITARFIGFINSLSNTGEFTDRMAQYVVACMRAITTRPGWAFLDLELALTSPAYREELLTRPEVQSMPDVVADLRTLQRKASEGKDDSLIGFIINRLRVLSSTQFLTNLFYQAPKLTADGKPLLDLRRIMDNPEGGYGHVVLIQASFDTWQESQATILGFFLDKINFNVFSRVDVDQDKRKPVRIWIDEPHKVIKAMEGKLAGTSVEFRKYRAKMVFTGHSIEQMGSAANSLLDGGAQITSFKTERLSELARYAHSFKPFDNAEELYDALPEKWKAVNAIRLPSGKTCPAFIADMLPPPAQVKDRSYVWKNCAAKYGRPWKQVRDEIRDKRAAWADKDITWLEAIEEARRQAKEEEKEAKKREKEQEKTQAPAAKKAPLKKPAAKKTAPKK